MLQEKEQEQYRKSAPTIEENIKSKSKTLNKWHKANPGLSWRLSWESPEYPEKEGNINIPRAMLNSPAYRSLSRAALLIYQDFLAKRIMRRVMRETPRGKEKVWVIENNGEIVYPYSKAVEKGFSRSTHRNAIDELQIKGFIDIKHLGKGGRKPSKGTGDVTKFWIDDRWTDFNLESQKSNRPPRKPRGKEKRQNRGFQSIWKDKKKAAAMLAKRGKK